MNKALILFLTCALSPLFAFADEESEALVKKAESGDPAAQFKLGKKYFREEFVMTDEAKAAECFLKAFESLSKAAEKGDAEALVCEIV
ncbi:MAG: hypothetical protein EBS01_06725 [Verrucomicrobia bacterium]|nr:hypothetical protein [Verrucomicrobiota bacterium]